MPELLERIRFRAMKCLYDGFFVVMVLMRLGRNLFWQLLPPGQTAEFLISARGAPKPHATSLSAFQQPTLSARTQTQRQ